MYDYSGLTLEEFVTQKVTQKSEIIFSKDFLCLSILHGELGLTVFGSPVFPDFWKLDQKRVNRHKVALQSYRIFQQWLEVNPGTYYYRPVRGVGAYRDRFSPSRSRRGENREQYIARGLLFLGFSLVRCRNDVVWVLTN